MPATYLSWKIRMLCSFCECFVVKMVFIVTWPTLCSLVYSSCLCFNCYMVCTLFCCLQWLFVFIVILLAFCSVLYNVICAFIVIWLALCPLVYNGYFCFRQRQQQQLEQTNVESAMSMCIWSNGTWRMASCFTDPAFVAVNCHLLTKSLLVHLSCRHPLAQRHLS